jgi:hypothetical protein
MNARSVVLWGFALATVPLVPACTTASSGVSNPVESNDGATPDDASGGGEDSGGSTPSSDSSSDSASSSDSSHGDSGSPAGDGDSGSTPHDSGSADGSHPRDSGECIRPPYQTTNECTGIGTPNGPALPSCSNFNASGQLICPTIPGCKVVPDPSGSYCTGDGVACGLSDCGHICMLPNWEPCYDVATGECLEGC